MTPEMLAHRRFVCSVAVALAGVLLGSETTQALLATAARFSLRRPSFARAGAVVASERRPTRGLATPVPSGTPQTPLDRALCFVKTMSERSLKGGILAARQQRCHRRFAIRGQPCRI